MIYILQPTFPAGTHVFLFFFGGGGKAPNIQQLPHQICRHFFFLPISLLDPHHPLVLPQTLNDLTQVEN